MPDARGAGGGCRAGGAASLTAGSAAASGAQPAAFCGPRKGRRETCVCRLQKPASGRAGQPHSGARLAGCAGHSGARLARCSAPRVGLSDTSRRNAQRMPHPGPEQAAELRCATPAHRSCSLDPAARAQSAGQLGYIRVPALRLVRSVIGMTGLPIVACLPGHATPCPKHTHSRARPRP